mgnify:CR=1 FL=1
MSSIVVFNYLEYGLLSFAISHICYTVAFGFKPRDLKKLLMFGVIGLLAYGYIAPSVGGTSERNVIPILLTFAIIDQTRAVGE